MTIAKYLSAIERGVLPVASVNAFKDDPSEASLHQSELAEVAQRATLELSGAIESDDVYEAIHRYVNDHPEAQVKISLLVELAIEGLRARYRKLRCSCWHYSNSESMAMWQMYCLNSPESVAIKADIFSLEDTLETDPETFTIGNIHYSGASLNLGNRLRSVRDLASDQEFVYHRLFGKSSWFRHESEVRIVHDGENAQSILYSNSDEVAFVPFDYSKLQYQVILHPRSPNWVGQLVSESHRRARIDKQIVRSMIGAPLPNPLNMKIESPEPGTLKVYTERGSTTMHNFFIWNQRDSGGASSPA